MRCVILVIVNMSVCPSVRLSVCHTRACVHTVRRTIMVSSPHHFSFRRYQVHLEIRRGSPQARTLIEGGVGKSWRFSTFKPSYLRNGARYDKGYYWSLIENRTRAFDWYQNRRPWLTLKWPWTSIMHSVALQTCFSESTTKIWMKIVPYCQRQKCNTLILVFSKKSFMRIFEKFAGVGASNESGVVENGDLRFFRSLLSSEPSHLGGA